MKRPKIPDPLAERGESVYKEHGYSSFSELVRDSLRRRVEELESRQIGDNNLTTKRIFEDYGIIIGEQIQHDGTARIDITGNNINFGIYGDIGTGRTSTSKLLIKRILENDKDNEVIIVDLINQYNSLEKEFIDTNVIELSGKKIPSPFELIDSSLQRKRADSDIHSSIFSKHYQMLVAFFRLQLEMDEYEVNEQTITLLTESLYELCTECDSPDMDKLQNILFEMSKNPEEYDFGQDFELGKEASHLLHRLILDVEYMTESVKGNDDITIFDCSSLNKKYVETSMYSSILSAISYAYQSDSNTTIVIDEGELMFQKEHVKREILNILRHLRHYNAQALIVNSNPLEMDIEDGNVHNLNLKIYHKMSNPPHHFSESEKNFLNNCYTGEPCYSHSEALIDYNGDKAALQIQAKDDVEKNIMSF